MRICADQAPPPPTGTAAWPCRPGGPVVWNRHRLCSLVLVWDWNRHRLCGWEMGVFGAVFGCRGDGGFNGCCSGEHSGVVGFKVATLSLLLREKVRPAWPDVCVSAK